MGVDKKIQKLVLSNFKRFKHLELDFDDELNVLIGDNESGKSSILLALDLVLGGSRSKIETIGLETLFNSEAVDTFLAGERTINRLPTLFVEIYLSEQCRAELNGKNNSKSRVCDGLRLEYCPNDDYGAEIAEALRVPNSNFPFEYYTIKFLTFQGDPFSGLKKPFKHLIIDSSQINSEYATREYTKSIYGTKATPIERSRNEYFYRKSKTDFRNESLAELNNKLESYKFGITDYRII